MIQSYSLASMVRNRRAGTSAQIPIIAVPLGFERSLLAQLRRVEQAIARGIRELIIPKYQQKLTIDADEASFDALRLLIRAMVQAASEQVKQLLALEGARHTKQWKDAARRAFGIDLSSVVQDEDLEGYLEQAALRNATLIRGLSDELLKRVAQETTTALINGESVAQLQERLKHQLGVSDSRARLIARDQTSKLTSDLNRIRHQQAGIERYVWRTSQDERVRPRHAQLEGNVYRYDEPTGAEEGLPPGQPIQCRCIAQAIVEFGELGESRPPSSLSPSPEEGAQTKLTKIRKKQQEAAAIVPEREPFNPTKKTYTKMAPDFPLAATRGNGLEELRSYTRADYLMMNSYLRTGESFPEIQEATEALTAAINRSPIPYDIEAWRGVGSVLNMVPGAQSVDELLGATIKDRGFVSVAVDPEVAEFFAIRNHKKSPLPPLMIQMRLRKGQKGLHVGSHPGLNQDETEIILPPGTEFRVVEVKRGGYTSELTDKFDLVVLEPIN